jgi:PAS domain S-box-containing protein
MVAPIRNSSGQTIGALAAVTDLSRANFLQKITATRDGQTGSYVLFSKQHRVIIMASDPKRTLEKLPGPGRNPMIDRAIEGAEGSTLMSSIQGVPALASLKSIPAPDWILAALLPTEVAFAPIAAVEQRIFLATLLATALAGLLTWWRLAWEFSPLVVATKSLDDTTHPPRFLPVLRQDEIAKLIGGFNRLLLQLTQREQMLQASQQRLHTLIEGTREAILVHRDEKVVYVNPAAQKIFGASSAHQLLGQSIATRVHPDSMALVRQRLQTLRNPGDTSPLSEQRYLKLDGTVINVEVEGRVIEFDGEPAIQITLRDITEQNRVRQELRIAAVAFECQEAMLVLDADNKILRANQAFTRISGYTEPEVFGQTTALLRSQRLPTAGDTRIWNEMKRLGAIESELWHRRKDGTDYLARGSATVVRDGERDVTHYVISFIDASVQQRQEEQRLLDEAIHRNVLVREVHHRIKNNLQGVIGVLRRSASKHPELAIPMKQAIGQVHSISVTYGLQGRSTNSPVSLDELVSAIARENQTLWQTPVLLDLRADRPSCVIPEDEAVPIALVLNELILNAVKHSGMAQGQVNITLQRGERQGTVQVSIRNAGQFPVNEHHGGTRHSGLQLVAALMPRRGASILRMQRGDQVLTVLELEAPVVMAVPSELHGERQTSASSA